MKCTHCNFTTAERISHCPNCGAPMVPEEQMYTAPGQNAAESGSRTFAALGSGLFLALCILVSASTLIGCFLGSYSVIGVLFTVFLWMVFAARRSGRIDTARLRCISGTVLAQMIVALVLGGLLAVLAVLIMVISLAFGSGILVQSIHDVLNYLYPGAIGSFGWLTSGVISAYAAVIGIVLIVNAAAFITIAIIGWGKLHRFVRSVYRHELDPSVPYECASGARAWAIVFASFCGLGIAFTGFFGACSCAAYIIFALIIGKYFIRKG